MRVHDFIPIEEHHLQAGTVLVSGSGSWLTRPATEALAGSDGVAIEFGEPRMIERGVVVALHWAATGPFANLNADLRLDPMPPARSHLSFKGSYEVSSSEADRNDAITAHHLTESCVRRFLVGVAVALERSRAEFPLVSAARSIQTPLFFQGPEPMWQR